MSSVNSNNCKKRKQRVSSKSSKVNKLQKLAYELGLIHQGLKSDTQVKDSYGRGLKGPRKNTIKNKPVC